MAINFSGVSFKSLMYQDLISVSPMANTSKDNLFYLDYVYHDKLKERRLKIEKIYENIKLKQQLCNDNIK